MKIELQRIYKGKDYTIGHLYVDGVFFCDTLEPTDRGLKSTMTPWEISCRKIKGKTAIPTGTYFIDMQTVSPRFRSRYWAKPYGGIVPRLLAVPCYSGVLIHVGTDENSTSGCLIVGENKVKGKVINSAVTYTKLMDNYLIPARQRGEEIWITIQ